MQIRFIRDYTVKANDGETFAAGQTYRVSEDSANHFISRGLAEVVNVQVRKRATPASKK